MSGKIIKLNYEINETLKTYNDILENPILIKSVNQENEENLFDFNVPSLSPGTLLYLENSNIYFLNISQKVHLVNVFIKIPFYDNIITP